MKIKIVLLATVLYSCGAKTGLNINGVYTRESASEYSRAWDTLTIDGYNNMTGTYLVERRTGFLRFKEGVPQAKQWHHEKMITRYDAGAGQLTDSKTGRLFSFKEGEVLFGTAVYKRMRE